MSGHRLGIDVGGTFTDVLVQAPDGAVHLVKTPSTPADQSEGVVTGIELVGEQAGVPLREVGAVLHGTTAATNAVLEQRGARVGVLVTSGFRHLFHLAEAWTPGPLFGFMVYDRPRPLVGVPLVAEVPGRLDAGGREVRPLDAEATRRAVELLLARGAEALTVCLLNSYASDAHERAVARIAQQVAPDVPVSRSSALLSEFREYERAVTTTMNAFVAPEMERYLGGLEARMSRLDTDAELQVVRSDGGLMSLDAARRSPIHTMLSGPAGGVNGAAHVAARAGCEQILTLDMGGTSTDVAVCLGGAPTITRETRVGPFPMRAPSVEVETIGAGGGSIAAVAEMTGGLRVGPRSAGAVPGPACYGRGGTEATVTDANVVLGHLPPRLLGGAMELDVEAARAAVGRLAEQTGMGLAETAAAIVDLVNENMLGALRLVTVQRGLDPQRFALVPFGGAGGLHANALAAMLGCFPVIVPPQPGVLSALGFVVSDVRGEHGQTFIRAVASVGGEELSERLAALERRARDFLARERVPEERREVVFSADMRYAGQGHELAVRIEDPSDPARLAAAFAEAHRRLYGFAQPDGAEIVTLRALAIGRVPTAEPPALPLGGADPAAARSGSHAVWDGDGHRPAATYARERLRPGMVVTGPAIVEQYDATTLVLAGHHARVDAHGNLVISPGDRP